jgi:MoaA/NifB/PqqE/SkfB family radical SAM enzyme
VIEKLKKEDIKNIELNLGKICNNKCVFCMTEDNEWSDYKFAKIEKVKEKIALYSKKGFNSLGFVGGEPTIYPDLFEAAAYAKKYKFKIIHMVTNGRMLASKKYLSELLRSGINRVSISFHSHKEECEDGLTRVKGSFKQKIQGLENLIKIKEKYSCSVSLNIVINKINLSMLAASVRYFSKKGINDFRLNFIQPVGRADKAFNELVPRYRDVFAELKKIIVYTEKKKINVSFSDIPFCILTPLARYIAYIGDLKDYINLVLPLGETTVDKSNKRIDKRMFSWKKRRKNILKTKPALCKKCHYNNVCEGLWLSYKKNYGISEIKIITEAI